MTVDAETVKRVARLARIKVSDEEVPALQKELNGILAFIEQLNAINIDGVEPMVSVVPIPLKMRADVVTAGGNAEAIIANAPASDDHCFLVPKVIE